ncbi:TPA: oxaloacetate decarboxylase subunit alpha, partial [Streptococcus pyogenes]|nr:oxaloacetate decarboxylase subunit alpha [Streptococcus pyogenes]
DLGYPPLVTPLSQMVGTQAAMNVILGKPYQMVSKEIKQYLAGDYGKTPAPVNEGLKRSQIGSAPVNTNRPADQLSPEFEVLKAEVADLAQTDEDVLTYALFPSVAKPFLTTKYQTDDVIKVTAFIKA